MTEYTSTADSFSATTATGIVVHFTVLGKPGDDTYVIAKRVARQNKWKKVKFFSFVGISR